jgi:hypothetical protein
MRFAAAAVLLLAGCSLDLIGDGDDDSSPEPIGDDVVDPPPPPPPVCRLADRYRMPHTDCGPLPPDSPPPTNCYWTIDIYETDLLYCYSDVCETVSYECSGGEIVGRSGGDRLFRGTLLENGNLYWDGGGSYGGEYSPY